MNKRIAIALTGLVTIAGCGQAPDEHQAAEPAAAPVATSDIHQGYSETADQYEVDGWVISNVDVYANLWNPRGKTDDQILERAQFLTDSYDLVRTPEQQTRAQQAREKYSDAIAINSVMIGAAGIVGTEAEHMASGLKRNHEKGITLASLTAFAFPGDGPEDILTRLSASLPVVEDLDMILVTGVDDIRRAKAEGKLAVVFNSQGADYSIEDLSIMEQVKAKGLLISGFTYNNNSALAGGGSKQDQGITDLGKQWVEKMNGIGLVVDCSHASNQTCIDAAAHSSKPIIASHSPAFGLNPINRNINDEAMQAIGKSGGAVCTTGVGLFLNTEGDASPEAFAKHVNYTGELIGRDKTCFSTDYMHNAFGMFIDNVANVDIYPPEKGFGSPAKNTAAEHIWDIAAILEDEYGWSGDDVRGFLGENLLRVYEANWE
jgi:microsomal dipeptidase-like Zn-dependent dipeptidase